MLQRLAGDDKAALDLVEDLFVGHEKDSFFVRSQGSMLVIRPCKWERKKASPSGGKLSPKVTDEGGAYGGNPFTGNHR